MSSSTEHGGSLPALDLKDLTDQQLGELRIGIDAELRRRETHHRREARRKIVELASQHRIDLASLVDSRAKYRDPENQFNSWSGRGRKPAWVVRALQRGLTLDDLRA
jgi:DNA-binding protein H-NS